MHFQLLNQFMDLEYQSFIFYLFYHFYFLNHVYLSYYLKDLASFEDNNNFNNCNLAIQLYKSQNYTESHYNLRKNDKA